MSSLKNKRKCSCLHLYFTQHTSIDIVCDIASSATLIQEFIKSAVKGDVQSPED